MTQNRFCRTQGGVSKAAASREIVRRMPNEDRKQVIDTIQLELGFTRAMARHYYYCALNALQEPRYQTELVSLDQVQNLENSE